MTQDYGYDDGYDLEYLSGYDDLGYHNRNRYICTDPGCDDPNCTDNIKHPKD